MGRPTPYGRGKRRCPTAVAVCGRQQPSVQQREESRRIPAGHEDRHIAAGAGKCAAKRPAGPAEL